MNNAINEIKNTLEGTKNRIMEAQDRISEVQDRMIEISELERKNEKPFTNTISNQPTILILMGF